MKARLQLEVMTPEHPLWEEFTERLEGPEGCDFQKDERDNYSWKCKGGSDKSHATAILKTMPSIDVEASLRFFEQHGGLCDCEILFNVEVVYNAERSAHLG